MSKRIIPLFLAVLFMIALFATVTISTAKNTYKQNIANEHFDEYDFYSMQKISTENCKVVFDALKKGDKETLSELMINDENIDSVLEFTDWGKLSYKKATSYGAGSLSPSADENGRADINEKFVVKTGGDKYVLYIESLTSRWGRVNEGVSAIAVTTAEHYENTFTTWNGEKDDSTALAGELFWKKQRDSKDS